MSAKPNGCLNLSEDDRIEKMLDGLFREWACDPIDALKHFPVFARNTWMKRFLAHYELFLKTKTLPGDIVELGVFRGLTLLTWARFLEIHNMGDRQKQVFGFDNWQGFRALHAKDGKPMAMKVDRGFSPEKYERELQEAIDIFDADRFIPGKPRIVLVKGDIVETVPRFVTDTPGLRISLLHFDCDCYEPTLAGLTHLWPRVVTGGVVIFDEYGLRPWEGEAAAVDEMLSGVKWHKFDWTGAPGAYCVKGE